MRNIIALLKAYGVLKRLIIGIGLLIIVFIIGVMGFVFIEHYPIVDAIYMTTITVASVGFGEVHPLTQSGKIFTSLLILFSIFIFAYAVTTISAYLVSVNSVHIFKIKKIDIFIYYKNYK